MDDVAHLATLAGAVPAVVVLTQVAKLLHLPRVAIRPFTVLLAIVLVLFAAWQAGYLTDPGMVLLYMVLGAEVALASWGAYDTATGPVDTLLLK